MSAVMKPAPVEELAEKELAEKTIRLLLNEARYFDQLSTQFILYKRSLGKHAKDCRQIAETIEKKSIHNSSSLLSSSLRTAKVFLNEGRRLRLKLRVNLLQQETTGLDLEANRWPALEPMFKSLAEELREMIASCKQDIESGTAEQVESSLQRATHLYEKSLNLRKQQKTDRRKAAAKEIQQRIEQLKTQADLLVEKIVDFPHLDNKYQQLSNHCLQAVERLTLRLERGSVKDLKRATLMADTFLQRLLKSQEKAERVTIDDHNNISNRTAEKDTVAETNHEEKSEEVTQVEQQTEQLVDSEELTEQETSSEAVRVDTAIETEDAVVEEPAQVVIDETDVETISGQDASSIVENEQPTLANIENLFDKKKDVEESDNNIVEQHSQQQSENQVEETNIELVTEDEFILTATNPVFSADDSVEENEPKNFTIYKAKDDLVGEEGFYPKVIDSSLQADAEGESNSNTDYTYDAGFAQVKPIGIWQQFIQAISQLTQPIAWLLSSFSNFLTNGVYLFMRFTERVFIFALGAIILIIIVFVLTYLSGSGYSSIGVL